jgi:hypothetical protein
MATLLWEESAFLSGSAPPNRPEVVEIKVGGECENRKQECSWHGILSAYRNDKATAKLKRDDARQQ